MSEEELPEEPGSSEKSRRVPALAQRRGRWLDLLEGEGRRALEEAILPAYLPSCRWFGGKSKTIGSTRLADVIPVSEEPEAARLALVEVVYENGPGETYLLPLQIATRESARRQADSFPGSVLAKFHDSGEDCVLFDGIYDPEFRCAILRLIATGGRIQGMKGQLRGIRGTGFGTIVGDLWEADWERWSASQSAASQRPPTNQVGAASAGLDSKVLKVEQSNSSITYEDKLFLKLYRKLEIGINPEAELIRYLSEQQHFPNVPPFAGEIEYKASHASHGSPGYQRAGSVLGLFLGAIGNEGDAWAYALDSLGIFFGRIRGQPPTESAPPPLFGPYASHPEFPELVGEVFERRIHQLGKATGGMHLALAAEKAGPDFLPEEMTPSSLQGLCEAMESFLKSVFAALRQKLPVMRGQELRGAEGQAGAESASLSEKVLAREGEILRRQRQLAGRRIKATITRTHGDYHLGQVLNTGSDFVIIDFEGEPSRPLEERKLKRSPLRDVAGMIRSIHYAPHAWLAKAQPREAQKLGLLQPWGELWAGHTSRLFLDAYLETVAGASFIPNEQEDLRLLLETFLIEKAVYEAYYELNNRPAWLPIPLRGILEVLQSQL